MELEDNEYESLLRQFQPRKPVLPPGMESTRRHRPRLRLAAAAAVVFVAGLSAVVLHDGGKTVDTSAVLESVDGAVSRIIDRHPQIAKVGARVEGGEVLRTSVGAGAVFALADGTRVEMRSESELFVEPAEDGMQIRLSRGGIIVSAARQGMGHLYVQTKDMKVSVVGTVFFVSTEEAGSRVAVIQGEVHVQQGTTSTKLSPGEHIVTAPSMTSRPVAEEIAWSRSAEFHLALLQQSTVAASAPQRLAFEAASVKPELPVPYGSPVSSGAPKCRGVDSKGDPKIVAPLGRCTGSHVSLLWMIAFAYDVAPSTSAPDRIVRSEGWISDLWGNGFQLDAKAENPATATTEQLRRMLQTLLEERFKLKVRKETRDYQGYAVSVGKSGARLQNASVEEPLTQSEKVLGGGVQVSVTGKATMREFVEYLDPYVVFDRTDLKGTYVFNFTYLIPDPLVVSPLPAGGGGRTRGEAPAPGTSPRFVALQSALREQLGLQLDAGKVPTEFIVIEHAEKPSEN